MTSKLACPLSLSQYHWFALYHCVCPVEKSDLESKGQLAGYIPLKVQSTREFSPSFPLKVHPIFVISVADCVLGFSWVLGGAFWFSRIENRSWCFLPSTLTVVHFHCSSPARLPLPLQCSYQPHALSLSLSDHAVCVRQPDSRVCPDSLWSHQEAGLLVGVGQYCSL